MLRHIGLAALAAICVGLTPDLATAQAQRSYALGTGTAGGTYYPVGVAIQALVEATLAETAGLEVVARPTAGSAANIDLLRSGAVQFALVQGLQARQMAAGVGLPADPRAQAAAVAMRSVAMLWPDVMHVTVRAPLAVAGTVVDLAAFATAPLSIGPEHSGTRASSIAILTNLGFEPMRLNIVDAGSFDGAVTAFEAGEIDGMILFGGVPIAALARLTAIAGGEPRMLGFHPDEVKAANGPFDGLWTPYVIPAGTYPSQKDDVTTIAEPNGLLVRGDVPDDDVYALVKAIFENAEFLGRMHPAASAISPEGALAGMTFPLHPGALRYFEEAGLVVPAALRPPGF